MTRFNERTLPEVDAAPPAPHARPASLAQAPPHPRATLALTSAATAVTLMTYTAPVVTLRDTALALHTPLSAQAWLINGTPLGLAAVLLVAGSLADDFGRRRIFLLGTLTLGITTALGALASSTLLFTLARIAQGAASAAILASSLGLIVHAFPTPRGRLHATGVWGAFVSGGIAAGPLVAGAMPNWRMSYGVLGAAALVVAALSTRALSESRSPRGGRPDILGALTFGLALVSLVAALTLGRDGWLRGEVGLLFLAAVVLVGVFVLVERRTATPMIDLGLLRRPGFLASSAGGLFTGLAVIGLFSFLPVLFQQVLGLSPMDTAWLFLLWSGLSFAVALQAKRLAGRVPPRHQLAVGFALHAAGVLTMLGAIDSGSWHRLLPGLILGGIGSGLLNAALPLLSVESVPAARAAMGSGAQQTFRYIGSCAGVALTIAIVTSSGSGLGHGANIALAVSAGLAALAAVAVLALRERA
ncbi:MULTISPECIES: MFS transporter [unclassified Streptomyces]|uniref:MFS transporter n=1 Tax=unclassified Streptomyces TaxID=2593676 RepID=UPI00225833EB|nr:MULTISPECIES: MFS transporter [unclassified Streptomyces]MCX5048451.1 MFS transporter [Streptomyces sp. NBC_00474]MCX5056817.1 MFS transporter [Streptomyces sp. NBC_00452]MCX5246268.1 MFS transporter [Streptomyces sp. NBC_00201]MCX5287909.1 MFS transporter [Streptomyces sp. NBC_00183]